MLRISSENWRRWRLRAAISAFSRECSSRASWTNFSERRWASRRTSSASRRAFSLNSSAIFWVVTRVSWRTRSRPSIPLVRSSRVTSCSLRRLFSFVSSSKSSASSSRKASTSCGSKPRISLTPNCCRRMSAADRRIRPPPHSPPSPKPDGGVFERPDQEPLEKVDGQDHDHGREVDPGHGQSPPDRPENRLGRLVEEPDDGVPWVGVDPGQKRPDDDDPEIGPEHVVEQPRHRPQEVAQDEHAYFTCPSSRDRSVARSTASISVRRRPPASSVWLPAIAVRPGAVPMSCR